MYMKTFMVYVCMCFCVFRLAVSMVTHHKVINWAVTWHNQSVVFEVDEESSCPVSYRLLKMTGCH